jgi:hypothetical protein
MPKVGLLTSVFLRPRKAPQPDYARVAEDWLEATAAALSTLPPGPALIGTIKAYRQSSLEPPAPDPGAPTPPTARERAARALERAVGLAQSDRLVVRPAPTRPVRPVGSIQAAGRGRAGTSAG